MKKNNTNNVEILNEYITVVKYLREKNKDVYKFWIKGIRNINIRYDMILNRFVFTGFEFPDGNDSPCFSCVEETCIIRKFVTQRYGV